MVVLLLEKVPKPLRGELSRWMIEPRPGVFVGQVSAMVRDRLWQMAVQGAGRVTRADGRTGGAMLLYSSPTEQGYHVRVFGDTTRDIRDWEGLLLVHIPTATAAKKPGRRASSTASPTSTEPTPESSDDADDISDTDEQDPDAPKPNLMSA
jgi:CRISPR-associated protein Cas2